MEHQREKQYVELILADLRLDFGMFEGRNKFIQHVENINAKLLYLLTETKKSTNKEIMEISLPATYAFDIPATTQRIIK